MAEQRGIIGTIAPYLRLLREHAIFGELSEQDLKDLVIRSDLLVFAPGELMLQQGEASDSALLITAGEAEVTVDATPNPVALGRPTAGALIGEVGVFAGVPRTATVRAGTEVEALRIGRDDMLQIGGENPAFLRAVMRELGGRIAAFNQAIGFYTGALTRLEQDNDPGPLADAPPMPELVTFVHALRRIARRMSLRRVSADGEP
jgi:CRP-like cAMP-binding protein